ncbi:MAG TPA: hypothetical protein VGN11_09470 [Candidatus Baltobacteraceae bacterium]|jgi:hypothetical protein|nr:hypothetical protein [Candidatus Baltobacteraceae bacterium]
MIQLFPLALGLTIAAAGASGPAVPPGTYSYAAAINGQGIGTSTITVTADGGSTVISEKGAASMQGQSGSANDTLTLGSDLAPSAYKATGNLGQQAVQDSATFQGNSVSVSGLQGTKSFGLPGNAKHFIVLDLGTLSGFVALPAQMKAWNNAAVLAVVPSYGQSLALVPDSSQRPARPTGVPANDVALAFAGQFPFTVWYDPATLVTDELDVPAQGLSVTRKP